MSEVYQVVQHRPDTSEYTIDIGEDTLQVGDKVTIEWDDESRLDAYVLVAYGERAIVKIV